VPLVAHDARAGTIVYVDPADGLEHETLVTGGRVKCQWKPDWALRWFALGVDYEMAGKDLIDSVRLAGYAVRYFNDRVRPSKVFRAATAKEAAAFADLSGQLAAYEGSTDAEALQNLVFEVGKAHHFEPLRDWFGALYQVLLGADQGPRFGSFVALYGVAETRRLIAEALAGKLVTAA
jgi:lysyl-tRNA synthetase class I